jgi:hypothetical protein
VSVAAGPVAGATAVGIPAGSAVGVAGPYGTAAVAGAPACTAAGPAGPWILAGTAAGAPTRPSFDPFMGGALYWSILHAFFVAPQYEFLV